MPVSLWRIVTPGIWLPDQRFSKGMALFNFSFQNAEHYAQVILIHVSFLNYLIHIKLHLVNKLNRVK